MSSPPAGIIQRVCLYVCLFFAAVFTAGQLLDTYANARSIVSPQVTKVGTLVVTLTWLLMTVAPKWLPILWRQPGGRVDRIGYPSLRTNLFLLAMLSVLWFPRLYGEPEDSNTQVLEGLSSLKGDVDRYQTNVLAVANLLEEELESKRLVDKLLSERDELDAHLALARSDYHQILSMAQDGLWQDQASGDGLLLPQPSMSMVLLYGEEVAQLITGVTSGNFAVELGGSDDETTARIVRAEGYPVEPRMLAVSLSHEYAHLSRQ